MRKFMRELLQLFIIQLYKLSPVKPLMGVDVVELNVTTVTELDNAIPEKWIAKVRADAERLTFFGPNFEGPEGSGKPIIRKDDFTREPGDTIHVQILRPLARAGVTAGSTLAGNEEQLALGQFNLTADWVRNAVAFNKRATRRSVFDAAKASQRLLSKWMAKTIDDDMFQRLIVTETAQTTLQAGNVASAESLGAGNVFTPDEIDRVKLQLMSLGALPFDVLMDNGQERPMYGIVGSEVSEYQLKSNSTWNQAQRDAGVRGEKNKIFTGALGMYNGVIVYIVPSVRPAHYKWGSYIRPEARVEAAHTAAATTINVGSTDSSVDYTEYFPQSGNFNVHVSNSNGTEIMQVTAHDNQTFTATRGQQGTTAVALSDGDILTLASNSVERERLIGFGSEMAVRTWAVLPTMQNELQDYRFKFGIGIEAAYGQKAVEDSRNSVPNYVLLNVAAPRP